MSETLKSEILNLIKLERLNCTIEEFKDKVDWDKISKYQKLSEEFIREFKDQVNWSGISIYQKLSEELIREFKDQVDWSYISKYQKLSEEFIREFKDKVDWDRISKYQKLTEEFIREFNLTIDPDNWLYWTDEQKISVIKRYYDIDNEGFIVAWKGIRSDRYSKYNFQFKYEKGQTYEAHCDCTGNENSFGLSAWTKEKASEYCNELLVRVKIHVSDIGRIVHNGGKIRCFKQTFLD